MKTLNRNRANILLLFTRNTVAMTTTEDEIIHEITNI